MQNNYNSSSSILAQVLEEMKKEQGDKFSLETINLAELERRTGISRMKLRTLKKRGFEEEKTLAIKKERKTVLTGFTGIIDNLLKEGANNMILTSNKQPDTWQEYFTEDSSLLCSLDRIFDDASVFIIKGESYKGKKLETIKLEAGLALPQASITYEELNGVFGHLNPTEIGYFSPTLIG